jgi:PAS domain S-box-containing protein
MSGTPDELQQYIRSLTKMLEGTSEPFAAATIDGRMISCNQAFTDLTGYTQEEIIGLSWKTDLTPPEYRQLTEEVYEQLHKTKQPADLNKEYVRKDGTRVFLNLKVHLLSDEAGRPLYYSIFLNDLTGYRQIEKKLIETEADFNMAQRMTHIGIWYHDLVEDRMYWSDEFCRILGYRPAECNPGLESYLQAIRPEDMGRVRNVIREFWEMGKLVNLEYAITRADGAIRHMHAEIKAIYSSDGKLIKVFGTVQDVTSVRLNEAKMAEAAKQAELYVDLLSHNINNINQVAIGYAELALRALETGGRDLSMLDKTIEMLLNSSRLISNVRTIQRIKAGEITPESIDMGSMINGVIGQYRSVRGRKVVINQHIECACKVMASELIREVFSNLIDNAIKHSAGQITIDVHLSKIQDNNVAYCKVTVTDNGPGIPDVKKRALFTRYMQGTTKAEGTGLGLYLVKSLIEIFKGSVWVEDRVPGDTAKGSRFVVMLPLADIDTGFIRPGIGRDKLPGA